MGTVLQWLAVQVEFRGQQRWYEMTEVNLFSCVPAATHKLGIGKRAVVQPSSVPAEKRYIMASAIGQFVVLAELGDYRAVLSPVFR